MNDLYYITPDRWKTTYVGDLNQVIAFLTERDIDVMPIHNALNLGIKIRGISKGDVEVKVIDSEGSC